MSIVTDLFKPKSREPVRAAAPKREDREGSERPFDPALAKKRKKRRGKSTSILASEASATLG